MSSEVDGGRVHCGAVTVVDRLDLPFTVTLQSLPVALMILL